MYLVFFLSSSIVEDGSFLKSQFILKKNRKINLKLEIKKWHFFQPELLFLDTNITTSDIKTDAEKIANIQACFILSQKPRSVVTGCYYTFITKDKDSFDTLKSMFSLKISLVGSLRLLWPIRLFDHRIHSHIFRRIKS